MRELDSIGKYSQQAVERKHQAGIQMYRRNGSGGVQGAKKALTNVPKKHQRAPSGLAPTKKPKIAQESKRFNGEVTMNPNGERVCGVNELKKVYPGKGSDWHKNYTEWTVARGLSVINLLRGLPFCEDHGGFVCPCSITERHNRWQFPNRRKPKDDKPKDDGDDDNSDDDDDDDENSIDGEPLAQHPGDETLEER